MSRFKPSVNRARPEANEKNPRHATIALFAPPPDVGTQTRAANAAHSNAVPTIFLDVAFICAVIGFIIFSESAVVCDAT